MKILHTITSIDPRTGGTAEAVLRTSEIMEKSGHDISILTINHPDQQFDHIGKNIKVIQKGPGHFGSFHYSKAFLEWLKQHVAEFDAVVVHGLWQFTGYATASACRAQGVPYFVFTHGMLDPWFNRTYPLKKIKKYLYWRLGEYRVLRDATSVLFTCEEERALAAQSFSPYKVNVAVVGLGTIAPDDTVLTKAAQDDAKPADWTARPYFLFMSRIHEKKGLDLLLGAYAAIRGDYPNAPDLVIAGPGEDSPYATTLRNTYPQEGVHWTGRLSGINKWSALSGADAMVLISHQENFGIIVAESLSLGVPVIISNKVNIHHEVALGKAGIVVDDSKTSALEGFEKWLSFSPNEKQIFAKNAKSTYLEYFNLNKSVERLLHLIQSKIN